MALICEEIRDRFSALWENELSPVEEAEVRGHLELCSGCQKEFARFDKTLRMLHSVQEIEAPEGFLSGIYEKMEGRKTRGLSSEKAPRGWFILSYPWKLPAQALAMVAIVFLALYLTQRMPDESIRMKRAEEARLEKAEKDSPPAQTDALRGRSSPEPSAASKPPPALRIEEKKSASQPAGKKREEMEVTARSKGKIGDERADGRSIADVPRETPRPKGSWAPQSPLFKMTKEEGMGAARGGASPGMNPSQEIVLKSPDPKKGVFQIQELVKQFKGEILTLEENSLLVSLPDTSFPEFRKQLEEAKASAKKQTLPLKEEGVGSVAEGESRRGGAGEKDKETSMSDGTK